MTTEIGATGLPVTSSIADDGSTTALLTARFELSFDRYLLPSQVLRQSVCIRSDTEPVTGFDECAGGLLLRPSYDPIRRVVTYYQADAEARLAPDTVYRITVLRPRQSADIGFRAFDSAPLDTTTTLEFRTVADQPETDVTEQPIAEDVDLFCSAVDCASICAGYEGCAESCSGGSVQAILTGTCAYGGCHAPDEQTLPAMGLDLRNFEAIAATAVLKTAHQTSLGGRADQPTLNPIRFGTAMPIVSPGNPGNSYLIYKVATHALLQDQLPGLAPGEADRLRGSVVVGMPMPAPLGGGSEPPRLALGDAVVLSEWMAQGAQVADCGP